MRAPWSVVSLWLCPEQDCARSGPRALQGSDQFSLGWTVDFPGEEAGIVTHMSHGLSLLFSEGVCERRMGYQHQ